jgi:penicillin-binding protein 2
MSSTRSRIGVLAGLFAAGFVLVLLHLWGIMVADHRAWARRSHENRWTFRLVPSVRGAVHDRTGIVLAHDEPTMELSLHYRRFRLWHAVGAAVHGATAWAQLQPGREGTVYSYEGPLLGPEQAAADLLAMPASMLRPGVLPKNVSWELSTLAATVLSATSGLPRKNVSAAMRKAGQAPTAVAVGDVLPAVPRAELLARYGRLLGELHRFEAELQQERALRAAGTGTPANAAPILFAELERLRRASLAGERQILRDEKGQPVLEDGEPKLGELIEAIASPFADHVPFELAASLRVGARAQPGLEVNPSVRRLVAVPSGSSLRALLGRVYDADRVGTAADWAEQMVEREIADRLGEIVPVEATANDEDRARMIEEAKGSFRRGLLVQERRGMTGIEGGFEEELSGRLGMRLVERDARRREQQLWSNLRVQSGDDVTLTIDARLQQLADLLVQNEWQRQAGRHDTAGATSRCRAGLAVIDAVSGDVLAVAGAPLLGPNPANVPAMAWTGNGDIGSVAKPFVLLEQLHREAVGLPHRSIAEFAPCARIYDYRGHQLNCDSVHGRDGVEPVAALAKSCNCFFYQCAEGFGDEGVRRALGRFGLFPPPADADYAACWQGRVRGLPLALPEWTGKPYVPRRAIGYEVHATPLSVARAYAALATGRLPELGVRLGESRRSVPLLGFERELEVVREGLRECVLSGTARKVDLLTEFGVLGKTGTAQVGQRNRENNAWFAGFLPVPAGSGMQLCICAVIYWVPDGVHGAEAAGGLVGDLLAAVRADAELFGRYLQPEGGR